MRIQSKHFLGLTTAITYPHCNGFLPNGRQVIICNVPHGSEAKPCLTLLNCDDRTSVPLPEFPFSDDVIHHENATICIDVAQDIPRVFAIYRDIAAYIDIDECGQGTWHLIRTKRNGCKLQGLPSITPDGERCLIAENRDDGLCVLVEYDITTQTERVLFSKSWYANHFHYCPHDPAWIGFSHEGATETIDDRCWAWHETLAPNGKCVFQQAINGKFPDASIFAGHERWCFHDSSALVVAYAVSTQGPRGIYEAFSDDRPSKLIWECNTAWHCNTEHSGRYIVIDTSAAWDHPPASPEEHRKGVEAHLEADRTKSENLSDVVLIDRETRSHLYIGRVSRRKHPYHPHPALSQDGKWLVYTDYSAETRGVWIVEIQYLN